MRAILEWAAHHPALRQLAIGSRELWARVALLARMRPSLAIAPNSLFCHCEKCYQF